ncbi:MAG: pantoate--beta-alanine ligase [Saprospiraceae bacterium]|nr:pantoate--beta-alanine ligase [Candidatus Opimibacter iunctus]
MPVDLVMFETIREASGLAMSSRNVRLSAEAREKAGVIYKVLESGKMIFEQQDNVPNVQGGSLGCIAQTPF